MAGEKPFFDAAIGEFGAVHAVSRLHGGIGSEDIAQDGFGAHGADGAEIGSDLPAFGTDFMAGDADGGSHFSAGWVATGFFGEGAEVGEFLIERASVQMPY